MVTAPTTAVSAKFGGRCWIFFTFPKPKTQKERCRVWIKQCGRPHDQLNPSKINKKICLFGGEVPRGRQQYQGEELKTLKKILEQQKKEIINLKKELEK
ncbi:uncharacterized protein LOC141802609 [Halichoeres trimaculatus]|uniref:uncharacterized protein LOC141802609 n=1 Tax=Halichoeres trimaculatus TaxID=147232 RepID=UPI003D9F1BAA